jgi:hypothetical protein
MYSLYNDTILDPFMGTGTTALAAIASGRNSIGVDIDPGFSDLINRRIESFIPNGSLHSANRISRHLQFIEEYIKTKGAPKYINRIHGFPVITNQEKDLQLFQISGKAEKNDQQTIIHYELFGKFDTLSNCVKISSPESQQISLFQ